jgi:hypothetical protein
MFDVVLCDFTHTTGWRVKLVKPSFTGRIAVIRIDGKKYLQIPLLGYAVKHETVPGRFCNPRHIIGI